MLFDRILSTLVVAAGLFSGVMIGIMFIAL